MEVTEEPLKGGEWQNISRLPFYLNTSIKAHSGWVSGIASVCDSDFLGFMQKVKFNVYSSADKLNPWPDSSRLKILHVRCVTLHELSSAANSKQRSLHPTYIQNCYRPPKVSYKGAEQHPSANQKIAQAQLSVHNTFITTLSWLMAWNSQILFIGINYWHLAVHW